LTTYTSIFDAATNSTNNLRKQIVVAVKKASIDIRTEDAGTANHEQRLQWSRNVNLTDDGPKKWAEKMVWRVLEDNTVRAAIVAATDATDAQVQAAVDAIITEFAVG